MFSDLKKNGLYPSNDVNHLVISGHVPRTPSEKDFCISPHNGARLSFMLETDCVADVPQDFRVVIWGQKANALYKILKAGDFLLLEGMLRRNDYTDNNGVDRCEYEINAVKVKIIGGRR